MIKKSVAQINLQIAQIQIAGIMITLHRVVASNVPQAARQEVNNLVALDVVVVKSVSQAMLIPKDVATLDAQATPGAFVLAIVREVPGLVRVYPMQAVTQVIRQMILQETRVGEAVALLAKNQVIARD